MTDDNAASTPDAARGAILPASDAPGGYADADVLKGRIAALERVSAENERLRAEVERESAANERVWRWFETDAAALRERVDAAEAKLRDVEALRDKWLAVDVPSAEVTSWSHYAGAALRAVLARSQAPQAPAEQEGCSSCGQQMDSPGCCLSPGREGAFHTVSGGVAKAAPSVRPATADDEAP